MKLRQQVVFKRRYQELTVREAARAIGVSKTAVARLEQGLPISGGNSDLIRAWVQRVELR